MMRKKVIIILFPALLFTIYQQNSSFALESNQSFVSVYNGNIVDKNRKEIMLRGIQIDFGSVRGDIPHDLNENKKIEDFFDKILDYVVTEDDFIKLKKIGANLVRLSLNTYKDFEYDTNPLSYRENNFKRLDNLVTWAKKYDIYVIISMRQSPGGHNSNPHSGNNGLNELWSNTNYQERLISLWQKIAGRYADNYTIIGYDLLNEPEAPNKTVFNKMYKEISKAIRKVDSNHIIFLEGNLWGKDLTWIENPEDPNTALSIHFYAPGTYAVKGKGTYPSKIENQIFDKDNLRRHLHKMVEYAQRLNRPVWVGEFGAMTKADNYLKYDSDIIQLFGELNLHWTYWNYKNLKGKSDTQAIYYAPPGYKFLTLTRTLTKSKKTFLDLDDNKLKEALESLKTTYFYEKTNLKMLLTNALHH